MLNNLKFVRKQKGLTQDQLSKMCGISQNAYSEIELGHYMPRLYVAFKISLALDESITFLFKEIYFDSMDEVYEIKKKHCFDWLDENIGDLI